MTTLGTQNQVTRPRRVRPKVFDNRITIRLRRETKQTLDNLGHVSRRRFSQFVRQQIELALAKWLKTHPQK